MLFRSEKSTAGEITLPCIEKCNGACNLCGDSIKLVQNFIRDEVKHQEIPHTVTQKPDPDTFRIIFSFSKQETAIFHSHLGLLEMFFMAFLRADIPVLYSMGFNPLPRLEIVSPLSLGIKARGEIAAIDTKSFFEAEQFKMALNACLPDGLKIVKAMNVHIRSGEKKHSLSSLLWGYVYAGKDGRSDIVSAKEEKAYRALRDAYGLERISVLARKISPALPDECGASYFEVYRELYPVRQS